MYPPHHIQDFTAILEDLRRFSWSWTSLNRHGITATLHPSHPCLSRMAIFASKSMSRLRDIAWLNQKLCHDFLSKANPFRVQIPDRISQKTNSLTQKTSTLCVSLKFGVAIGSCRLHIAGDLWQQCSLWPCITRPIGCDVRSPIMLYTTYTYPGIWFWMSPIWQFQLTDLVKDHFD